MKLIEIDISSIKINIDFQNFYEEQEEYSKELEENIINNDLMTPLTIDEDNVLVNGHLCLRILKKRGDTSVKVYQLNRKATLLDRVNLNLQRSKTDDDLVKEFEFKINLVKKQQGRKKYGIKKTYAKEISVLLNGRWKDEETINKIIEANKNDFGNKFLTKSILNGKCSPNAAYDLIKLKKYDKQYELGFCEKVESGQLSALEATKLIKSFIAFKNETNEEFSIPNKCYSHNIDCTKIGELGKYNKEVDLIYTSIPYYKQKKYQLGQTPQPWNKGTLLEYCDYMADLVKSWVITLKDSANIMINVNDMFKDGCSLRVPELLLNAILQKTDLKFRQYIIWSKKNCISGGKSEERKPKNNIELILWLVVDTKKYYYKPIRYSDIKNNTQKLRGFGHENVVGKKFPKKLSVTSGYSSIWTHITEQETEDLLIASVGTNHKVFDVVKTFHPAVLSGFLPVCPILFGCPENGLVYDPMSGTNIVGYISQILNRRSLSTELSSLYFKDGCENLINAVKKYNPEGLKITNKIAFGENPEENYDNAA